MKAVEKQGDALPNTLQQGWTARLATQKQNLSNAAKTLTAKLTGDEKAGGDAAVKALQQVFDKVVANLTAFSKQQNTDAKKIVQDYDKLLNARVKATVSS